MAVDARSWREEKEEPQAFESDVSAYESRPGRVVFVEEGNSDGWLATDLTVDTRR